MKPLEYLKRKEDREKRLEALNLQASKDYENLLRQEIKNALRSGQSSIDCGFDMNMHDILRKIKNELNEEYCEDSGFYYCLYFDRRPPYGPGHRITIELREGELKQWVR